MDKSFETMLLTKQITRNNPKSHQKGNGKTGVEAAWWNSLPWLRPVAVVVHMLSHVRCFTASWTAAQASLPFTISRRLLKLISTESMMLSSHIILCCPLLLSSIFPSLRLRWVTLITNVFVQLLKRVWHFATPWTTACQASLSFTISQSLLKLMSTESVMPSAISSSVAPFSSCPQSFPNA